MHRVSRLILFFAASFLLLVGESFGQWVRTSMPDTSGIGCLLCDGSYVFAGTIAGGIYASTDSGNTWTQRDSGLGDPYVSGLALMGTSLFAGTDNGVYRSTDMGSRWQPAGLINVNAGVVRIAVFDTTIFAITNCYCSADQYNLMKSSNKGRSWVQVSVPPSSYTSILSIFTDDSAVFIGTIRNGVDYSTDFGADWIQIDTQAVASCVDAGGGKIWTVDSRGLEYSSNGGVTWDTLYTGLPSSVFVLNVTGVSIAVNAIAFVGSNVFIGTNSGIYVLKDNGSSWTPVNSGLPESDVVSSLAVCGNYMIAGISQGVWRRPLSDMLTAVRDHPISGSSGFFLAQNYPNPCNPSTVIAYEVSKQSHVELTVYDVLGRRVATLVDADKPPGRYEAMFDGADLPSGVYFYRIRAGIYTAAKKLILVK